jgi:hypothetical protein
VKERTIVGVIMIKEVARRLMVVLGKCQVGAIEKVLGYILIRVLAKL